MKTTLHHLQAVLRLFAGLLFAFMAAAASVCYAAPPGEGWDGSAITDKIENTGDHDGQSPQNAIPIKDAAELAYLAQQVNNGEALTVGQTSIATTDGLSGYYFILSADIDLNGHDWTPIGNHDAHPFKGHFNGDGHVVRGLTVNVKSETTATAAYAGLFGYIENGTLRNLGVWLAPEGVKAVSSQRHAYAGGLVGNIYATGQDTHAYIRNCYVETEKGGTISSSALQQACAGGIAGANSTDYGRAPCTITHCYATVDVDAVSTRESFPACAGGIAGNASDISYTYATGNVEGKGKRSTYAGGICGYNSYRATTNSLALNKELNSAYRINRIAGDYINATFTSNYATPRMKLNGKPATSGTASDADGADTWTDKFQEDLQGNGSDWTTAWEWPEGQLPHLKKENIDGSGYSTDLIAGQIAHAPADFLSHSPWADNAATSIENATPAGATEPGNGLSPDKPILIKNAAELAYLAKQVNAGGLELTVSTGDIKNSEDNKKGFSGYYFALSGDIMLDGGNWIPIGIPNNPFCGNFDGKGHIVDELKVEVTTNDYTDAIAGLFGYVKDGSLCNLGIHLHRDGIKAAASSKGSAYAGGIVGDLSGDIGKALLRNCYVVGDGIVEATGLTSYAGGIAGAIYSKASPTTLTHCYATVDVETTADGIAVTSNCHAGGIVGWFSGTLSYTYATGSVKANKATNQYAGGICGVRVDGELTHNLALNSEVAVESGTDCHRIAGYDSKPADPISSNYARADMRLNGATIVNTPAPDDLDGASTWAGQFSDDLQNAPASPSNVNEWTTAWIWHSTPPSQPDQLPQLRLLNPDGSTYADTPLGGQPSLAVSNYLPDPASIIENKGGGDGSSADTPIRIRNAAELAYFARQVNTGGQVLQLLHGKNIDNSTDDSKKGFAGYHFALSDDIDLEGQNWTPIGKNSTHPFTGHFNGDGHAVKELKVSIHSEIDSIVFAGLFGYIQNGTLCNLGVWLERIEATSSKDKEVYAGGLAGNIEGVQNASAYIRNCYVDTEKKGEISCSTSGQAYAGGITGASFASSKTNCIITHCYATVNVKAESTARKCYAGGIAGRASYISYTYATGEVEGKGIGGVYTGGICGGITGSGGGALTNNLALNKEMNNSSGNPNNIGRIVSNISTITNATLTSNYATPLMKLNGQPATSSNASDANGADTWTDKFKNDLQDNGNEWSTAWAWTDGQLPQLNKRNPDDSYSTTLIAGQTPRQAADFLYHSPWKDNAATSIENSAPAGATQPGDGLSPNTPILIKDAAELAYLAQQVNEGGYVLKLDHGSKIDNSGNLSKSGFSGYYFALSENIELEGGLWTPIGENNSYSFRGNFDGKGHTVDELKVEVVTNDSNTAYAGLFGRVEEGTLCNLGVRLHKDGIKATASNRDDAFAGGIAGYLIGIHGNALLRNCFVVGNGKVETTAGYSGRAGGIAGAIIPNSNSATLTHCYTTVDVEATANKECFAGGIVGWSDGTLSYTYATGNVTTNSATNQYAGGICGRRSGGELAHNLALNSKVTVANGTGSHRIAGAVINPASLPGLSANYARPAMSLNNGSGSTTVTSLDGSSLDGADTWLDTFASDLVPPGTTNDATNGGWTSGAWTWPAAPSTLLPKLALVTFDDSGAPNGFTPWPATATTAVSGSLGSPAVSVAQPDIDAAAYLVNRPLLHVTQPAEGGTLAVYLADPANPMAPAPGTPPLTDGTNGSESIPVAPGTALWLTNTPKAGYDFEAYLSGPASDGVTQPVSGQSLTMTAADLWITASFDKQTPPTPVYYTVTLPCVEGATTDPVPGTYTVESWDNFRFYLTLEDDYSESQPVVTTDRGETITPRTSDGAYIVNTVRSDVAISIAGIVENDPVANEPIAAPSDALRIWTEPGTLCIHLDIANGTSTGTDTDTASSVRIISADGRLLHDFHLVHGLNRRNLAHGLYIVQAGQTVRKVIVK